MMTVIFSVLMLMGFSARNGLTVLVHAAGNTTYRGRGPSSCAAVVAFVYAGDGAYRHKAHQGF